MKQEQSYYWKNYVYMNQKKFFCAQNGGTKVCYEMLWNFVENCKKNKTEELKSLFWF